MAPQSCAQGGVYIGVVALEYAEFEFVGSGSGVACVDGSTLDEMVTPYSGEEKRPWDGAADAARLVFYCEFTGVPQGGARREWVVPTATDDDRGIQVGHREQNCRVG